MNTAEPIESISERGEIEYLWIGVDDRGVALEIVGVVIAHEDLLLILHVMPHIYRRK